MLLYCGLLSLKYLSRIFSNQFRNAPLHVRRDLQFRKSGGVHCRCRRAPSEAFEEHQNGQIERLHGTAKIDKVRAQLPVPVCVQQLAHPARLDHVDRGVSRVQCEPNIGTVLQEIRQQVKLELLQRLACL